MPTVVLRWMPLGHGGARAHWGDWVGLAVHPAPPGWMIELSVGPPHGAQLLMTVRCNALELQEAKDMAVDIATDWLRFYNDFWPLVE